MTRRADYGNDGSAWFDALEEPVAAPARALRKLIRAAVPDLTETIKWGMPLYERNGKIVCSIRCTKTYAALQLLLDGIVLDDPGGLIEGSGKTMRHVKVRKTSDIKPRVLTAWLRRLAAGRE